jgi:hypothetical protein
VNASVRDYDIVKNICHHTCCSKTRETRVQQPGVYDKTPRPPKRGPSSQLRRLIPQHNDPAFKSERPLTDTTVRRASVELDDAKAQPHHDRPPCQMFQN